MRTPNPRHRYDAFYTRRKVPETDTERSLYVALHGSDALNKVCPLRPWPEGHHIDPLIHYPVLVYKTDSIRSILEAFLIASKNDFHIAEAIGMPPEEVSFYRHVFFDTGVFRTELELIVFMQEIPEDHPYKAYYRIAYHQGLGALRWQFCRNKGEVPAVDVVKTVMTDAYFRSLEHRGQLITGKLAREAAKYAKISVECARALLSNDSFRDEDAENLRIKFEEARGNRTVEDIGADKVVH